MKKRTATAKQPHFVKEMRFSKPWRPYQQRVLDKLPEYLDDAHFHLVSAPGSGKTVTGLEVLRRIGQPALVLAPTIAIREQWIRRLTEDFLGGGEEPEWISRDLTNPAQITISSYQSLSSEFRKENGMENVVRGLGRMEITTLVVDEAHHLRANWWQCLTTIKEAIPNPTVIALTATPPIDVPAAEWNRYASFCGPVDIEVGIPELVAEGNLCPHQDYVLFSVPNEDDVVELTRFRKSINQCIADIAIDVELAEALGKKSSIPWVMEDDDHDFLKKHQTFYLALAIFLQSTGGYIPPIIRDKFSIVGKELPTKLNIDWAEALLHGITFSFRERIESSEAIEESLPERLAQLEERLRDIGAVERGRVVFKDNEENEKILRDSSSKLEAINQIVQHEIDHQGALMRAVVLTDYIRKESFPGPGEMERPLVKLGVVPIFEALRRIKVQFLLPGALTGSIVVVPKLAEPALIQAAEKRGIDADRIDATPLAHDPDFLLIEVKDSDRQKIVATITELFEKGEINCLIGTASLLGEGWDAPALNTLVLASVIGSFVMSNQMRGRAIRTDPKAENKVSNIWHIAAIQPKFENGPYDPGKDFEKLQIRFGAFHGVGFDLEESGYTRVESGWNRIGIGSTITPAKAATNNRRMFRAAEQREVTEFTWKRAIAPIHKGRYLRAVKEINTPRKMAASRFIAKLSGNRRSGVRYTIAGWMEKRRLRRIAKAVYISLAELKLIDGHYRNRSIDIDVTTTRCFISVPYLDPADQAKFITALDDFFDIFLSPRYIVEQQGRYFAVPKILAATKHSANRFSSNLNEAGFGNHELIYVHSEDGRQNLLEARKQRMLNHFDFQTETKISWQPV